jgi:hypothetical protein
MRCFAQGPRFEEDFFIKCHDISRQVEDTTMCLLHYFALPKEPDGKTYHHACVHADWIF